jgi:hypothetical protein
MSVATSDKHSKKSHRDFDKNETTKKSSTNTISSSKEVASRRDEEVRRKRRQVERQMKEEEERVRRKRERSKSRTGELKNNFFKDYFSPELLCRVLAKPQPRKK